MKKERKNYAVAIMSRVLGVSSGGYYKWLKNLGAKTEQLKALDSQIKVAFDNSFGTYGSPRVVIELGKKDVTVSKSTVARRMKLLKLCARPKRKFVCTTDSDHPFKVAENLLNRNFTVEQINKVWVSDITYVRVANYWMYLTIFLDLGDKMVAGWSLSSNMTAKDTVIKAFSNAVRNRGITKKDQLMVHSDRGVQYASAEFRKQLDEYHCIQSMSRKGNCWDNAVAESFFKTIKVEYLNKIIFNNKSMLEQAIFRYIDGWYNTVRIHSALGGISPLQASLLKKTKRAA